MDPGLKSCVWLARYVRDLQHGLGPSQARRGDGASRRGGRQDAALAVPDSTCGDPDGAGSVSAPCTGVLNHPGVPTRASKRCPRQCCWRSRRGRRRGSPRARRRTSGAGTCRAMKRWPVVYEPFAAAQVVAGGWEYLRATIAIDDPPRELCAGMVAVARIKEPVAAAEPFRSLPAGPPPFTPQEPRGFFICPDHPGTILLDPGRCPIDRNRLEARAPAEYQRLRWWCPMHPAVTADRCRAVLSLPPMRRHGPPAPAWSPFTLRGRSWPYRDPRSSTPARGKSSGSRTCPGCSTASK